MTGIAFWGDSLVQGMINPTDSPGVWTKHNTFDGGLSGDTGNQIKVRFLADTSRRHWVHVIWAGQNVTTNQDLKDSIAAIVDKISHGKFLVISTINAGMTPIDRGPAGSRYLDKMEANAYFATLYGSNYYDLHGALVDYGISINDTQSINYDAPPSTYQPTDIHLTGPGGYLKCNQLIYAKLNTLGYLDQTVTNYQITRSGGV